MKTKITDYISELAKALLLYYKWKIDSVWDKVLPAMSTYMKKKDEPLQHINLFISNIQSIKNFVVFAVGLSCLELREEYGPQYFRVYRMGDICFRRKLYNNWQRCKSLKRFNTPEYSSRINNYTQKYNGEIGAICGLYMAEICLSRSEDKIMEEILLICEIEAFKSLKEKDDE